MLGSAPPEISRMPANTIRPYPAVHSATAQQFRPETIESCDAQQSTPRKKKSLMNKFLKLRPEVQVAAFKAGAALCAFGAAVTGSG